MTKSKKTTALIVYYLLLVLLFMSWTDINTVPNGFVRLVFLGAVLFPAYLFENKLIPAVMTLFLGASTHGFTSSYMPAMIYTYTAILPVGLVFFSPDGIRSKVGVIMICVCFLLYVTIVNLISSFEFQDISQALIIALCILCYVDNRNEKYLHLMSCSFMIAAIMLSYSLLSWGATINALVIYGEDGSGFHDVNYSSCVVSLGCIAALVELFKNSKNKLVVVVSIATLAVSVLALALNASRASLLSIVISFAILILTSKTRKTYKILIVAFVVVGIWYLYMNDYFELLMKRIEMDDEGGTGRTEIWSIKLNAFFNESNILQMLFGWGYSGGRGLALSSLKTIGFHNDFLAFLVEYGLVGGLLFLCFYFYPLWQAFKKHNNFLLVNAICGGFFIICFTLEPLAAGRLPYYFFWIYMFWWASIETPSEDNEKQSVTINKRET